MVTIREDKKVTFFDKADKSLRALLGGKGRHGFDTVNGILRLTSDSIQYRPRGYDELATAAPLEIPLADIIEAKPAYLGARFPVWMHVVFFALPTVLWWLFKPLGIWHRPLVSVRTSSAHYYFWVKGKRDEWIQAINEQRASLQTEQARYLRG